MRGRVLTPMERAADGLDRMGTALSFIYDVAVKQGVPKAFDEFERVVKLGERAVVAMEKIATAADRATKESDS